MSVNDNPSLTGVLPAELRGRQARGGPSSGGYITINISSAYVHNLTGGTDADTASTTHQFYAVFGPPVRITSVTVVHDAKAGATAPTFALNNADLAAGATDLIAAVAFGGTDVVQSFGGNATAFADQDAREVPEGGRMKLLIATAATDDAVTNFCVSITGWVTGHEMDDPADD